MNNGKGRVELFFEREEKKKEGEKKRVQNVKVNGVQEVFLTIPAAKERSK